MKKNKKRFHLLQFRWMFIQGIVIVIGSVMSFGLVVANTKDLEHSGGIMMLEIIPFMTVLMVMCSVLTTRSLSRKMTKILDGMEAVADGNMDVMIDAKGAGEYAVLYEDFNKMVKELKLSKENMQNFSNEFTHELKTPITSIKGFAGYLIRTGADIENPERMQYLHIIEQESGRLSDLAQKTLLLSKLDSCQIVTDREEFDLSEQVKRCVILMMPQIEKKEIQPVIDLPDMKYYGNAELIEQIWINLLSNAIRFTPEKGQITVSGMVQQDRLEVRIADNGEGMSEEILQHVFERYYQSKSNGGLSGNGIGLAIVARITELCGGEVRAESIKGEGSAFTVTFKL